MSGFEATRSISLAAGGADIAQYTFVKTSAAGLVTATAGDDAVGIALEGYDDSEFDDGNASNVIPVAVLDGAKMMVVAGDDVTAGAAIASDANGKAVDAAGVTTHVLGYAIEAGAADEVIQIVGIKSGFFAQS